MTYRRINTRYHEMSGYTRNVLPAARAVRPHSTPDDSGAFCFADARHQRQLGHTLLGRPESYVAVEQPIAEAMRPCVCCREGLERCDVCQGRGRSEDRDTCDYCLGLGYASCNFCGGSGLVGYDAIAPELRVGVAVERIKEASRQLDAMMRRPATPSSDRELRQSLDKDGRTLLALNRVAATIEDSLHLLHAEKPCQARGNQDLSRAIRFGLKRAAECILQMRTVMKNMAVSALRLARQSRHRTKDREIAVKRAAFYASLLKRPELLTGTGFERALLSVAIERLRKASAASTAGQDPTPQ